MGLVGGEVNGELRFVGLEHGLPQRCAKESTLERLARNNNTEVRCGFLRAGSLSLMKAMDLEQRRAGCDIVVVTTIFHNYDLFKDKKNDVFNDDSESCGFTFIDEETCRQQKVKNSTCDTRKKGFAQFRSGARRVVVVDACALGFDDLRRASRMPKMLGFRLFPKAKYIISIDARLILRKTPRAMVDEFLIAENKTFMAVQHPKSLTRSVYEEANIVVSQKLADAREVEQQMTRYRLDGLPSRHQPPVHEMAFFVYDARDTRIQALLCAWFDEYMRGSVRDQLCWSYVVWKLQLIHTINSLPYRPLKRDYLTKGDHLITRTSHVPLLCPRDDSKVYDDDCGSGTANNSSSSPATNKGTAKKQQQLLSSSSFFSSSSRRRGGGPFFQTNTRRRPTTTVANK